MKLNGINIITLDTSKEFQKNSLEKLRQLNLLQGKFSIILSGVDGNKIIEELNNPKPSFSLYSGWKLPNSTNKFWLREMTNGEVGCVISHFNAWVNFFKSKQNNILILEQDFIPVFEDTNWSVFDELENYDWDIIFLGRHSQEEDIEVGLKYFVKPRFGYQAHAYIISKRWVEKFFWHYYKVLRTNLIPTDEFLPAMFTKHPREDIHKLFPNRKIHALALRVDAIAQSDWEGTGRSRTAPK